jgi:hypothetical protein
MGIRNGEIDNARCNFPEPNLTRQIGIQYGRRRGVIYFTVFGPIFV